jgi:hypothetical protein
MCLNETFNTVRIGKNLPDAFRIQNSLKQGDALFPVPLNHFLGYGKAQKCPCALTEHHAMKTYWGVELWLHVFLTSALDGGEWSASRPGRFTIRKEPLVPIG